MRPVTRRQEQVGIPLREVEIHFSSSEPIAKHRLEAVNEAIPSFQKREGVEENATAAHQLAGSAIAAFIPFR